MLTGGKLGDMFGRRRIFSIGLFVYGVGSLTTALSPNITRPDRRLVASSRASARSS